MKITIIRQIQVDLDSQEFNLVIHALQSHARIGDSEWPDDAEKAADMRDALMNAELQDRDRW
jgi:hypothetical protein